jgi:hypothetical protein
MGKDAEALEYYEKTDGLAPRGFFTAKTALWALQHEKDGTFPKGTYRRYMEIEWAKTNAEKAKLARSILAESPTYAPALKELALLVNDPNEKLELIQDALGAQPDSETYGILMINKALNLQTRDRAEAIRILALLVLSTNSTPGTVVMSRAALLRVVANETR